MANGWKYVDGEPQWRPDTETARAELLSWIDPPTEGEHADVTSMLNDLVTAVRREAAEEIRSSVKTWEGMHSTAEATNFGKLRVADLIDPDSDSDRARDKFLSFPKRYGMGG